MLHQTETVHPRKAGPTRRAKPWSEMLVDTQEGRRSPASLLLAAFLPSSIIYWLKLAKGMEAENGTYPLSFPLIQSKEDWRAGSGRHRAMLASCPESIFIQLTSLSSGSFILSAPSFRVSPSLGEGGVNGPLGPNTPLPLFWALQSVMSP